MLICFLILQGVPRLIAYIDFELQTKFKIFWPLVISQSQRA